MSDSDGITIFPEFEHLQSEIAQLRAQLCALVLERDQLLFVECRNIETAYMLAIGGLEYRAFELKCTVLRLKRKAELLQAQINKQERVDLNAIETILDLEFEEYRRRLDEQLNKVNEALAYSHAKILPEDEAAELKKLYHAVIKALHPDLHPNLSEAELKLFYNAVSAYKNGDLQELRLIAELAADSSAAEAAGSMELLEKEQKRLAALLAGVSKEIAKIRSEYPYTMKELLADPEAVASRKAELDGTIRRFNEAVASWQNKIDGLVEKNG